MYAFDSDFRRQVARERAEAIARDYQRAQRVRVDASASRQARRRGAVALFRAIRPARRPARA
jgi:hypothetical protein